MGKPAQDPPRLLAVTRVHPSHSTKNPLQPAPTGRQSLLWGSPGVPCTCSSSSPGSALRKAIPMTRWGSGVGPQASSEPGMAHDVCRGLRGTRRLARIGAEQLEQKQGRWPPPTCSLPVRALPPASDPSGALGNNPWGKPRQHHPLPGFTQLTNGQSRSEGWSVCRGYEPSI